MTEHKTYLFLFLLGIMLFAVLLISVNSKNCPMVCDRYRNATNGMINGGTPEYYACWSYCEESNKPVKEKEDENIWERLVA